MSDKADPSLIVELYLRHRADPVRALIPSSVVSRLVGELDQAHRGAMPRAGGFEFTCYQADDQGRSSHVWLDLNDVQMVSAIETMSAKRQASA